jgi:PAS domain S-box-containing protein
MRALRFDGPRSVALAAGMIVTALGVSVLAAWYVRFVPLIQMTPGLVPMHRMTALATALSGTALTLLANRRKRAAAVFALPLFLIGILVCGEYSLNRDFGIDLLLGPAYINTGTSNPGRMSPISALCYLSYSLAVLALCSRRLSRFSSAMAGVIGSGLATVGLVSFASLLAYRNAYSWGGLTSVSLPSAVSLTFLGCGLLAMAREERPATKSEWLPVGVGIAVAAAVLGIWQALVEHEESDLPLISAVILAGGLLLALLLALAVYQAQRARSGGEALRLSEERFRGVFENSPLGLALVLPDYRIMEVNDSMHRMLGYAEGELDLLSPLDFTHPDDREESNALAQRLFKGEVPSYTIEKRYVKKNGEIIWATLMATVLHDREGRVLYSLGIIEDITERKHAQEALRDSEARFRGVFENSPLGLALIQRDYRLAKVNASLCRMSGYSEAELLNMNPLELTHPGDREESRRLAERLFAGEIPFYQIEKRYVKKNGEIIWVTMTATVVRDAQGRALFGLGMVQDISERKRAETELRLGSAIFANMEEGVCLVRISDGVIVHANRKFERMYGYQPEEIVGQPVSVINDPAGRPSREIEDEIRAEVLRSGTWRGEILQRRKDGRSFWCAVTGSTFRHPEFGYVGISIHQDINERKHAEEALRQSEERFRSLFEQGPIGVTLMAPDWRLLKVNAAFCRMMGYSEEELTRMTPLDITYPDDIDPTVNVVERLFKTEIPIQKIEKRYVRKSGEIIWGSLTASVIHDREGKAVYAMGMIEDITDRKRAEDELRAITQRLSLATRSAAMGVWEWNLRTERAIWDDTMFQIFGIPKTASVRRTDWTGPIHPEDRAKVEAFLEAISRGKTHDSVEFRLLRRDGSLRHVSATGAPSFDTRGDVVGVVGIAVDITQRKQGEEELHALSVRLSQAARFASMGVWELDPLTRSAILDDTSFAMLGVPRVTPLPFVEFTRWVHPDDLPRIEAALERIIREKTQDSVEFRVIRPDGVLRHAYTAGGPVLDEQRNVVRVLGTAFDITQRKRAEEKLQALSERLSMATRSASIGVWDWDLRTNMTVWDDMLFEMVGIPKVVPMAYEEFVRRVHPDDLPKVQASLDRAIAGKTQDQVEFRIIRPDGSLRHLSSAEGVVLDEKGNVVRVVGTAVDISERKHMEAQIEASREQMVAAARLSALGMMAGGIAHEINNPLSIIHAMASDLGEMVEENGSAPPQVVARKSAIIRETAERIAKIVKSLRQISREGAGDVFHPTRLAKILEETLEICQARFKANGVKLLLPQFVPELSVSCREVQIAQALLNLLQNAFDAVVEQKGERWVRLEVSRWGDSVSISVIDNGPGIPLENRSRIGEPFFTTKPVGKGTGLGLSLSKTIAEEHGGKLEYGEDLGHTRFSLLLPLAGKAEAA